MLAAADPSDGVEDVLMFHPAGLEAADPACELEEACLKRHGEYRAEPEGGTQQDAGRQGKHFDAELHDADGDIRELLPDGERGCYQ